MAYDDVLFPTDISYGSSGGPGFRTLITQTRAFREQRLSRTPTPIGRWQPAKNTQEPEQIDTLRSFYIARRGAARSFRYEDPIDKSTATDHRSAPGITDETLGVGAGGSSTQVQLVKSYTSGAETVVVPLTKVDENSVRIAIEGVENFGWSVDRNTGIVTLTPGVTSGFTITGGCNFYKHVRFAEEVDDLLNFSIDEFDILKVRAIELVEVIEENSFDDEFPRGGAEYRAVSGATTSITAAVRSYTIEPTGATDVEAILPDPTTLAPGYPWFTIENPLSATKNVNISYPASTGIATVAPGEIKFAFIGVDSGGASVWKVSA